MLKAVVIGTGSYLPEKKLTNKNLEKYTFVNTQGIDYQIDAKEAVDKSGIEIRRIAVDEATSDLAAKAGQKAIDNASIHPDEIDLVLLATSTPDYRVPKCAPLVAAKIGLHGIPAYDFGKDCTGFLECLESAAYYIQSGRYDTILIIGADKCSWFVNYKHKASALLYGDGAGAVVMRAVDNTDRGFLHATAGSQGNQHQRLYIPQGGTAIDAKAENGHGDKLVMDGKAMHDYGMQVMPVAMERVLSEMQMAPDQVDWMIPHQSNLRVIEGAAKALGISMDKVLLSLQQMGNTASAAIPLALDEAARNHKIKENQILAMVAYGAGLSWMSALMKW